MRLHTRLNVPEVAHALDRAKDRGLVDPDIRFPVFRACGSRTHARAFEIQLGAVSSALPPGTTDRYGKQQKTRRVRNSTREPFPWEAHEPCRWAATWHEWGWFMAEVFAADPSARFGNRSWGYASPADFNAQTGYQFVLDGEPPAPAPRHQVARPAMDRPDEFVFGPAEALRLGHAR